MAYEKLKRQLVERGAEILEPTNQWEALRFRCVFGVGIIYQNKAGRKNFNEAAQKAADHLEAGTPGTLAAVPVAPRRKPKASARTRELTAIIKRDGGDCFFCGGRLPPLGDLCEAVDAATVEHLVPRAHGGPDHLSNKFAAHMRCNREAGHLSAPEKIAMRDRLRAPLSCAA